MSWWAAAVIIVYFNTAATLSLVGRAPASELKVLRPRSGDIVVARDRQFRFNITWTNNTLDFNASIAVRQGPPTDLQRVATINASTINDGTYIWAGNYDDWLQGYGSGPYPSSGCNYTIEISAGGQRALSEYFTVQNDDDGGLNTTVECPTGSPDITDGNVATNTNYNGNGGTQSCGYSAATLGGAIAGVGAFFLTLFAATFVIGLKGGWIIFGIRRRKRGYDAAGNGENDMRADSLTKGATVEQNEVRNAGDEMNEYMRLYRKYGDAQMVGGMPLYQMPGNRDGS